MHYFVGGKGYFFLSFPWFGEHKYGTYCFSAFDSMIMFTFKCEGFNFFGGHR